MVTHQAALTQNAASYRLILRPIDDHLQDLA